MVLDSVIGFNREDAGPFFVGIAGQGPALAAFLRLVEHRVFRSAFPHFALAGWYPGPGGPPKTLPKLLHELPVFSDIPSLFAANPGIMLALDLSPDQVHMQALRAHAPLPVALGSADTMLRFCAAAAEGALTLNGDEKLRKAQTLFALLVDQVDGDILILDADGVILDSNHHVTESRGLTQEQILGKTCSDIGIDPCIAGQDQCPYRAARATGKQAQHTFAQTMPNGRVRYTKAQCLPVLDALGGSTQYLYLRRDVTEQQHLEKRLQQTEKMAAIGELSTYMAHEIRNPLFSIGGFANALLRNPSLNDLAREKARIIYDESRRLDLILTSILNFARPTDQTMGVFDTETVARQTLDLMTIGSEERGIILVTDIQANLPKTRGNAENLKQCLINIVKNALEAMPDGGTLTLRAKRQDDYVRLDVEDTGQGIPPELFDQIFSPFFSTKHGGAGLGLAMARKIIDEMGGKVLLDNLPDAGTRVSLLVPVALAVEENGEEP